MPVQHKNYESTLMCLVAHQSSQSLSHFFFTFSLLIFLLCFLLLPCLLSLFICCFRLHPFSLTTLIFACSCFSFQALVVFFSSFLYLPNRSVNRDPLCGGTSLELCSPWGNKSFWYNIWNGNQRSESLYHLLFHAHWKLLRPAKALLNTNCQSHTKWGKWNS